MTVTGSIYRSIFRGFSLFKLVGRPLFLIGTFDRVYATTQICQRLGLLGASVIGMQGNRYEDGSDKFHLQSAEGMWISDGEMRKCGCSVLCTISSCLHQHLFVQVEFPSDSLLYHPF